MTLISFGIGAPHRHSPRIATSVRSWIAAERERRRIHHEMRDLARLPEYLLRDVGLDHLITPRGPEIRAFWR